MGKRKMKTVSAKVTEEEYNTIQRIANQYNISISALIKQSLFDAEIADPKPLKNLTFQVKAIGINFNQITKYCNYRKEFNPLAKSALHEIYLEIGDLLDVK